MLIVFNSPKSEQGKMLRKHFIFKIIPILNPDGVSRGFYRLDTLTQNLNRFYLDPTKVRIQHLKLSAGGVTHYMGNQEGNSLVSQCPQEPLHVHRLPCSRVQEGLLHVWQ